MLCIQHTSKTQVFSTSRGFRQSLDAKIQRGQKERMYWEFKVIFSVELLKKSETQNLRKMCQKDVQTQMPLKDRDKVLQALQPLEKAFNEARCPTAAHGEQCQSRYLYCRPWTTPYHSRRIWTEESCSQWRAHKEDLCAKKLHFHEQFTKSSIPYFTKKLKLRKKCFLQNSSKLKTQSVIKRNRGKVCY